MSAVENHKITAKAQTAAAATFHGLQVQKILNSIQIPHQFLMLHIEAKSTSCFSNLTKVKIHFLSLISPKVRWCSFNAFCRSSKCFPTAEESLEESATREAGKIKTHLSHTQRGPFSFSAPVQLLVSDTSGSEFPWAFLDSTIPGCTTCSLAPLMLSLGRVQAAYLWETLSFSLPSSTVKNRWGLEGMKEIRDEGIKLKDGNREERRGRERETGRGSMARAGR